ncbi:MAG: DUF2079 domain-containing protein [Candidatus Margulisbacteria bacterium]|nr:DUF2079 domain-containing protein [Candidatus Margulisiibacteriota bacterium]
MGQSPFAFNQVIEKYKQLFSASKDFLFGRNRDKLFSNIPYILFALAMIYYVYNLSFLSILAQANFGTGTHDVGVYDQVIWLASRFMAPISTLGCLSIFATHASFYCILLAPLFWICPSINILYIAQSVFLAAAAIPIFLYGKRRLGNSYLALTVGLSFLLYPALQNMNLENFHPEAIVIFFIAWAIYFMFAGNYRWYYLFLILSIIGKEEVSLTAIFIGLYLWLFKKEKKHGVVTIAIGVIWFLFCSKILMPWANGALFAPAAQPLIYSHWFGAFSQNSLNPQYYWNSFISLDALRYINELMLPVLYIPLLAPATLFMVIPSLAVNMLSNCGYFRSVFYHYNYVIIAVLFYALIDAICKIGRPKVNPHVKNALLITAGLALIVSSFITNCALTRIPMVNYASAIKGGLAESKSIRNTAKREALRIIPKDARISVSYSIWPQLSHRKEIYLFPNPFQEAFWTDGVVRPPALLHVDYLAIEWGNHNNENDRLILQYLMNSAFFKEKLWCGSLMILQHTNVTPEANMGANYTLYNFDKPLVISDDFSKNLSVRQTGKFSMLYFPDSNREFKNLLGESIPVGKGFALEIFGYLFIPVGGEYHFNIASDSPTSVEIEGRSAQSAIRLQKGFHSYKIKYIYTGGRYNLKLFVTSPQGKIYIVPDKYLMRENIPTIFSRFISQFDREKAKLLDFDRTRRNALLNGGFDIAYGNQPKDWQLECWQEKDAGGSFVLDQGAKKSGRFSGKLQSVGLADSRWVQIVEVSPNTPYKLCGWIKTVNIAQKGDGAYLQAEGTSIRTKVLFGTNDWQYVEAVGRTGPDHKELKIQCRLGNYGAPNTGTAHFDDIVFKEMAPAEMDK